MNSRIKQLWIAALLSGVYKKIVSKLKTSEGFCCLGVLTDLYIQEHNSIMWEESCGDSYFFMNDNESLPDTVAKWADLDQTTASLLSDMNDTGDDFEEIVKNFIQPNL